MRFSTCSSVPPQTKKAHKTASGAQAVPPETKLPLKSSAGAHFCATQAENRGIEGCGGTALGWKWVIIAGEPYLGCDIAQNVIWYPASQICFGE